MTWSGLVGDGHAVRFSDDIVHISTEADAIIAEELRDYVCPSRSVMDVAREAAARGFMLLSVELESAAHDVRIVRDQLYRDGDETDPRHDNFLRSFAWRRVRMVALAKSDGRCACCGRSAKDGVALHVDHIKPRRKFPELALEPHNLQVLCEDCNHGKGNDFQIDWRVHANGFRDK